MSAGTKKTGEISGARDGGLVAGEDGSYVYLATLAGLLGELGLLVLAA